MNGDSGITRNRFWPGGRYGDKFASVVSQHVLEIVKRAGLFRIFHFQIRNSGLQTRGPVCHPRSAIDQPFFIESYKSFTHCPGKAVIEGEAFTGPVATGTQTPDLTHNLAAKLMLPLPDFINKLFPGEIRTFFTLFGKHFLYLQLGGNTGMIRSGNP